MLVERQQHTEIQTNINIMLVTILFTPTGIRERSNTIKMSHDDHFSTYLVVGKSGAGLSWRSNEGVHCDKGPRGVPFLSVAGHMERTVPLPKKFKSITPGNCHSGAFSYK